MDLRREGEEGKLKKERIRLTNRQTDKQKKDEGVWEKRNDKRET
jgi:hypothetical protein